MSAGGKSGGGLLGLRLNAQFQWFVRQVRPFLQAHLLSVSLIVLSSLMFLLDPLIIKWLIDRILPRKDAHLLVLAASGFFLIYLPRLGFSALGALLYSRTLQNLVFPLHPQILHQINHLS